jgi:NADH-quinone oxidoreductase subunit C
MNIQETTKQGLAELFKAVVDDTDEARFAGDQSTDDNGQEATARLPGIIEQNYTEKGFHLDVLLEQEQLLRAAKIMFDLDYFLESITGIDWIKEDRLEAVYDFSRYDSNLCRVAVRVFIPRLDPHLPTITGIYSGANWHERETHDFFGIVFDGHPHLIPLLLPEDADFHPLLKDFKT